MLRPTKAKANPIAAWANIRKRTLTMPKPAPWIGYRADGFASETYPVLSKTPGQKSQCVPWVIMNALVHSRHESGKTTGLDKPIATHGDALEIRYASCLASIVDIHRPGSPICAPVVRIRHGTPSCKVALSYGAKGRKRLRETVLATN